MITPTLRHIELAQNALSESPDGHDSWLTRIAKACAQAAFEERSRYADVIEALERFVPADFDKDPNSQPMTVHFARAALIKLRGDGASRC